MKKIEENEDVNQKESKINKARLNKEEISRVNILRVQNQFAHLAADFGADRICVRESREPTFCA